MNADSRTYKIWSGNTVSTQLMRIDDALEFSMLCDGIKTHVRSKKKLILQTAEKSFPRLVMLHNDESFVPFVVKSVERQMLLDMTEYDVICEGFSDLTSFKNDWKRKHGEAFFSPHEMVYRYEVDRFYTDAIHQHDIESMIRIVQELYPDNLQ